jgi:sulfopyruvate decarboxylase subunit beta
MMQRDLCFKALAEVRGDAIVVTRYSAAFDWGPIDPSPLNYTAVGAMGQCSSYALGMALGMPSHKIIVLDGDGSLLMNLGSLVTIASVAPKNFVHFVCENGCYEVNGGHPIPGQGGVSFAGFARAAGYAHVFEFDDLTEFQARIAEVLALPGPVFATLKVVAGGAQELDFGKLNSAEGRQRFKEAIKPFLARERTHV